jgi:uncharacterized repeat protein (TIGR03803 family)
MQAVYPRALCTCILLLATYSAHAQNYTVLHSFKGAPDGSHPYPALIRDPAGNFYGTTELGGAFDQGTVFKMNASGGVKVLYSFSGTGDGAHPRASLLRGPDGSLYGTAPTGGTGSCSGGCGVIFKIDRSGHESVLYSLHGGLEGGLVQDSLVADNAGNLYGSTEDGGDYAIGTVFKLDPAGNFTTLFAFSGLNGNGPNDVIRDAAGNFYGTTATGGNGAGCLGGCGVIYKLDSAGNQTVLYTFQGGVDGAYPTARLLRDGAGNLYSTTLDGGAHGYGTVFKLDASNNLTVLYSFAGAPDGGNPLTGVIRDGQGNLYGTAWSGGTGPCQGGCGAVFKLTSSGSESLLHNFLGSPNDGSSPEGGLVADSTGFLYGVTYYGGEQGNGIVFKVKAK